MVQKRKKKKEKIFPGSLLTKYLSPAPFLSSIFATFRTFFFLFASLVTLLLKLNLQRDLTSCPDETCLPMYTNHSLQTGKEVAPFATVSAYCQCHCYLLSLVFEFFLLFRCSFLGQNPKDAAGNPYAEWVLKACCCGSGMQNLECYQKHS